MLPNHWVWNLLSSSEKQIILDACHHHNNMQYAQPDEYDRDHKRSETAETTKEGKLLQHTLEKYAPTSVLEIGVGSGFYARQIFNWPTVQEYHAVDIVQPCLEYVKREIADKQSRIKTAFFHEDFLKQEFGRKYDLILFMSTLHHIPNRLDYMKKCASILSDRGAIVIIEPTHRIIRLSLLLWRFLKKYGRKSYWEKRDNLSTHSFMTMLEINYLKRKCDLKINELKFFNIIGGRFIPFALHDTAGVGTCNKLNPLSIFGYQVYASFSQLKRIA
jgi:SAM-dependent methyltransferase